MRQLAREANLAKEPLDPGRRRRVRVEQLERDAPIGRRRAREVNDGHTSAPQLALDDVAGGERFTRAVEGLIVLGHVEGNLMRARAAGARRGRG